MKPGSSPRSFWRVCLIAAFAASAFTAIGGVAGGVTPAHAIVASTLWDNNYAGGVSNPYPGSGSNFCCTNSQNYTGLPTFADQAADDFTVPAGHQWVINEVDVAGSYYAPFSSYATSVNVFFYNNSPGTPGTAVSTQSGLAPTGALSSPSFSIPLTASVNAQPRHVLGVSASERFRFWVVLG